VKWAQLGFIGRRVRHNLWQLLWNHALTAATLAITLFIFGAFMLAQENLEQLLDRWGSQIQINAYLDHNLGAEDTDKLAARLRALPEIEQVRYISQARAWDDFRAALGAQSGLLDGLSSDVLPASFEITLKANFRDAPIVAELAARLRKEKGVALVEYPREWVERMSLLMLALNWAKWLLGGVLFLATFFIVGSTVKLAAVARRDEVEIMQLVGASETLIEAPFVVEGMLQGLTGAALSLAALWGLFHLLRNEVPVFGLFGAAPEFQFLALQSIGFIVAVGWLLGAAGSLFSLRRFIRTWKKS